MKARLICVDPVAPVEDIVLDSFPVVIGRNPEAEIHLDDCWVSRRHCEIDENGDSLMVRDLSSRNGTLVNGSQISESPLSPNDELTIGISTFIASFGEKPQVSPDGGVGVPLHRTT